MTRVATIVSNGRSEEFTALADFAYDTLVTIAVIRSKENDSARQAKMACASAKTGPGDINITGVMGEPVVRGRRKKQ